VLRAITRQFLLTGFVANTSVRQKAKQFFCGTVHRDSLLLATNTNWKCLSLKTAGHPVSSLGIMENVAGSKAAQIARWSSMPAQMPGVCGQAVVAVQGPIKI